MTRTILLLFTGIAVGTLVAKQNEPWVEADPIDIIIEKSNQTMRQAAHVSAMADEVVAAKITEMKETIEVLEEEKEQLVEQVKEMENEIIAIKTEPAAQPFDVLAIVPDTTR